MQCNVRNVHKFKFTNVIECSIRQKSNEGRLSLFWMLVVSLKSQAYVYAACVQTNKRTKKKIRLDNLKNPVWLTESRD